MTDDVIDQVHWDLDPLLEDRTIEDWLAEADTIADEIETFRGKIAEADAATLLKLLDASERLADAMGRAGYFAMLHFSTDTANPENGARLAMVEERSAAIGSRLVFVELEWAEADDAHAEAVLADPSLHQYDHYLRSIRRTRPHLLSEPEERLLTEFSPTGRSAWVRLFDELTSAITLTLPEGVSGAGTTAGLEQGLTLLHHPDRGVREGAANAVTAALAPGLSTRAFVYNTVLADKSTEDRFRRFSTWISSRNLDNEASDESVQALIEAVVSRYDIPQRWYTLKAGLLGIDQLTDYDRYAPIATEEQPVTWTEAKELVLAAYDSFSPEMAGIANEFFDGRWIDAPVTPGKRPGAFCAYTVASHHPYVLLNWTGTMRDVATLAHELGHGIHAYLSRQQGNLSQSTPLTLAETASVFGEQVTQQLVMSQLTDPTARLSMLAAGLEDSIATVFRQVAMNRFEDRVHQHRRNEGELSTDMFAEAWIDTQRDMLGDSVQLTDGYKDWWSYVPHFIGTPGYVYAYAYGQLLALSVYAKFVDEGPSFVPSYVKMLSAGGSMSPEALCALVDCDITDPAFWANGLTLVDAQLAEAAAASK